jgi:hypothetical protein
MRPQTCMIIGRSETGSLDGADKNCPNAVVFLLWVWEWVQYGTQARRNRLGADTVVERLHCTDRSKCQACQA